MVEYSLILLLVVIVVMVIFAVVGHGCPISIRHQQRAGQRSRLT
ncbi:MAG: hypothetical protein WBA31_00715 [Candidatus Dormiibacterota bacterium]